MLPDVDIRFYAYKTHTHTHISWTSTEDLYVNIVEIMKTQGMEFSVVSQKYLEFCVIKQTYMQKCDDDSV